MKILAVLAAVLMLGACTPLQVQQAGAPPLGFQGARIERDAVVSFDGARLGLSAWQAMGETRAVVVAVHGMNDYANAFHLAAPWWAEQGVTTYAYDQRGFGRSPQRGVWGGDELMVEDLRVVTALARQAHPGVPVVVLGESMGGAVTIEAFASDRPPAADRVILTAPAVWGWSNQPLPYKTMLWFAANFTGAKVYTPPNWLTKRVMPTDNREELIAMGRDPLMIWGARSDTLYGLVAMMEKGWAKTGGIKVPVLYLYGAHDPIIPREPTKEAAARLKTGDRTAYYAKGYHLLTRDRQGPVVWNDMLSFVLDPAAPLPSGAPPIPTPGAKPEKTEAKQETPETRAGL